MNADMRTGQGKSRRELFDTIGAVSFFLDDLRLYLDTHPDDAEAFGRFKELQQESVYETILKARLEAVRSMLKNSQEPISQISEKCGWSTPASLKKIFKRRFNMSMRDYRSSFNE
jgi:YesN/AraC family two-component response regulator